MNLNLKEVHFKKNFHNPAKWPLNILISVNIRYLIVIGLSFVLADNRSLLLDVVLRRQDGLREGAVHLGYVVEGEGIRPKKVFMI